MGFVKKSNAQLFLLINALLWGSSYVWQKMLLGYLPCFSILAVCSFGSLVTILIFFFPSLKGINKSTIFTGIAISSLAVLSNTFCLLALQNTSSSNASFILQTSVIMTPIIMTGIDRKFPGIRFIFVAIVAIAGIFLLTSDFKSFSFHIGDLFALGAALFFSMRLAALNKFARKLDPVQYTFVHHSFNLFAFLILASVFEVGSINFRSLVSPVFAVAIFASIFVAVSTELIQSKALKFVKPEKATLIYTLEPLTTVVLAFALIGESFSGP
ncbi:MAG: DMT family transporter, partial [Clostridiales bacterium]|nr:DMT family transporter [Clostridiales bacterium]